MARPLPPSPRLHDRPVTGRASATQTRPRLQAGRNGALLLLTCWACTGGEPEPGTAAGGPAPGRRDSAGVVVVTHTLEQLRALPLLEVDTVPELTIGAVEGPPGAVFHEPRLVSAREDGAIVVADDAGTVLRLYDAGGRHLASQGREGDGPGEYRHIVGLGWLGGDSLVAYDLQNARASVLDPELGYIRSLRLPADVGYTAWHGSGKTIHDLGTGRAVMLTYESSGPIGSRTGADARPHVVQDTLTLSMLRPQGQELVVEPLFRVPGVAMMVRSRGGRSLLFAPRPFLTGNGAGFVVAHGSRFELRRFDASGRLRQIVRVPVDPRPATDEERERIEAAYRRTARNPPPGVPPEALDRDPPAFAEHHPLLEDVELDAAGNVWVQPDPELMERPGRVVFGPDGEPRAWYDGRVVRGPVPYRGGDFVLDLRRDGLGVPYVVKYDVPDPVGSG